MALGLKKNGCSAGAALAYWLGNPLLNPATMVFMGLVLGWRWVGLRVAVGLVLVFGVAYFVDRFARLGALPAGGDLPVNQGVERYVQTGSIWVRWLKALWQLSIGLIPEYILLVFALGAARAWLFPAVTPGATGLLWTLGSRRRERSLLMFYK